MKFCPKCNTEHNKHGIHCSRKCANSRIFSEESKLLKSNALKGKSRGPASPEEIANRVAKFRESKLKKYLETPFTELGCENRRRRVFEEQEHKCNKCGISEWFSHKISLELEHKDGNTANNVRENLEGLCPNCHSITDTWRGRNKPARNGAVDITDKFLLQCLQDTDNIRQGLLKAGISAKGNNYARAKKLLEKSE